MAPTATPALPNESVGGVFLRALWLAAVAAALGCSDVGTGPIPPADGGVSDLGRSDAMMPDLGELALRAEGDEFGWVGRAFAVNLRVEGASPPVVWEVAEGSLPPGILFAVGASSAEASLEGIPEQEGTWTATVAVMDASNRTAGRILEIAISAGLRFESAELPDAVLGQVATGTITTRGALGSLQVAFDGALPDGVTASPVGPIITFSGTPTSTGAYPFGVQLLDEAGQRVEEEFVWTVRAPLRITPESLPVGRLGERYEGVLQAEGSQGAVSWRLQGELPAGMQWFSSLDGLEIFGIAGQSGTFPIDVTLSDPTLGRSTQARRVLRVETSSTPLTIEGPSEVEVRSCEPFQATWSAEGGGRVDRQWSTSGLPTDFLVDTSNRNERRIAGIPGTLLRETTWSLTVTDASGQVADLNVTVEPAEGDAFRWGVAHTVDASGREYVQRLDLCRLVPDRLEPGVEIERTDFEDLRFSADGRRAAIAVSVPTNSPDSTRLLYLELDSSTSTTTVIETDSPIRSEPVVFAGDTRVLVSVDETIEPFPGFTAEVVRWAALIPRAPSAPPIPLLPSNELSDHRLSSVSPDGRWAVVDDGTQLHLVDLFAPDDALSSEALTCIDPQGGASSWSIWGPDSTSLAYRCRNASIQAIRIVSGAPQPAQPLVSNPGNMEIPPPGGRFLLEFASDGRVSLVDLRTQSLGDRQDISVNRPFTTRRPTQFAKDGRHIVLWLDGINFLVPLPPPGAALGSQPIVPVQLLGQGGLTFAAFSPSGDFLLWSDPIELRGQAMTAGSMARSLGLGGVFVESVAHSSLQRLFLAPGPTGVDLLSRSGRGLASRMGATTRANLARTDGAGFFYWTQSTGQPRSLNYFDVLGLQAPRDRTIAFPGRRVLDLRMPLPPAP